MLLAVTALLERLPALTIPEDVELTSGAELTRGAVVAIGRCPCNSQEWRSRGSFFIFDACSPAEVREFPLNAPL
jgi:hypothetical protein